MNSSISNTCEWPRYRDGAGGAWRACGESLRFDGPNGTVHLVMWASHQARYVGPCCWKRVDRVLYEQAIAMYGADWAKVYTPHVDNPEEERKQDILRRRFAWTLQDVQPPRVGGLMRQDGSDNYAVDLPRIPVAELRRLR